MVRREQADLPGAEVKPAIVCMTVGLDKLASRKRAGLAAVEQRKRGGG